MHAWSTSMLLLLHSAFKPSLVKMLLKGEVGGSALNSHGNYMYIVDHGISWKNHGIVFLNFCGNPASKRTRSPFEIDVNLNKLSVWTVILFGILGSYLFLHIWENILLKLGK